MELDNLIFADIKLAEDIIRALYPNAQNISFVNHGYDNLVGLVDETYALRFPRNQNAYLRSQDEKNVLRSLASVDFINIPKILGEGKNPPYLITSFLHGTHLKSAEINDFSKELQIKFGESVGVFAFFFHQTLKIEDAKKIRIEFGLDKLAEEPWDIYFKHNVLDFTFPTVTQDILAKNVYNKWLKFNSENKNLVVLHDDLHTENMLFEENKLIGVLDFGDTNIGSPEQELRQLYRINELVLQAAIDKYNELSGLNLNIEFAKNWAIMQELAVLSENLLAKDSSRPSFDRATKNLNKWFPEEKWVYEIEKVETNNKSKQ